MIKELVKPAYQSSPVYQSPTLSQQEISHLLLQRMMAWIFFFPVAIISILLIRAKFNLNVKNIVELRKKFQALTKTKRPILVCSNHLTLVDSLVIIWALSSLKDYFFNFRLFCWNVPAVENYCAKLSWKIFTYLGKCIPINRFGEREHTEKILEKLSYLVSIGELCMVFPEGTRSRSGQVVPEEVTYGIGKIMHNVPGCSVLCLYLRGDRQCTYSDFPEKGDSLYLDLELITPQSPHNGRRAIRDFSIQTISKIRQMEEIYFQRQKT